MTRLVKVMKHNNRKTVTLQHGVTEENTEKEE